MQSPARLTLNLPLTVFAYAADEIATEVLDA